MGTPIRPVDAILGVHKVDVAELDKKDRLVIVEKILQRFLPYLRYMSGFNEIGNLLNQRQDEYNSRETSPEIIGEMTHGQPRLRCMRLAKTFFKPYGENPAGSQFGCHYTEETDLLLTQEGKVLKWEHKYRHEVSQGLGFDKDHTGRRHIAEYSRFSEISGIDLELVLVDKVFLETLDSFRRLINTCIEERQKRLDAMQHVGKFTEEVLSHIEGAHSF